MAVEIRADLLAAQRQCWEQVTSPGASWSGEERAAIATLALVALDDPDPLPPWVSAADAGRGDALAIPLPRPVVDATYRIARHAATTTESWYRGILDQGVDAIAYVELVGVVCTVAAVDGFYRAIGMPRPELPDTVAGPAIGGQPEVVPATLNWVPVVPPADVEASVVQGLSAAGAELANVKRLAAVQYIPFDEMGDLGWNRGTLSRGETELVAARLSSVRECFF